jgi:hypothetical protein
MTMRHDANGAGQDAFDAEKDTAPGVIPIANGKGGAGSRRRGKKEEAAAAKRMLEAQAAQAGASVAVVEPPAAPPKKGRSKRAAEGMTPEERRVAAEQRERKAGSPKPEPPAPATTELAIVEPPAPAPAVVLTEAQIARAGVIVEEIKGSFTRVEEEVEFIGSRLEEALAEHLYLATHPTFPAFVEHHFDVSYRQAQYIIGSAKALTNLKSAGVESLPKSINAARQLISVPPEHQVEVWTAAEALAKAEGRKTPSERHVATAARESGKQTEDARRGRGRPVGSKNAPKTGDGAPGASGARGGAPGGRGADPIERARAEGTIPADAHVVITEKAGEPAAPAEPITDEDWLDQFPIRDKLTVSTRRIFDVSALGYRAVESGRKEFSERFLAPAIKRAELVMKDAGPYLALLAWAMRLPHPSQWRLCASCNGTGELAKKKGQCPDCERNGFHV